MFASMFAPRPSVSVEPPCFDAQNLAGGVADYAASLLDGLKFSVLAADCARWNFARLQNIEFVIHRKKWSRFRGLKVETSSFHMPESNQRRRFFPGFLLPKLL